MPLIGLGVWKMAEGEETEGAVRAALKAGYRHIDTAKFYGNERSVGKAVRASGVPREDIFVTTKLWPTNFLNPEEGFHESLEKLGLGYVDLYLIHWPVPLIPRNVWQTLEKIYAQGIARAIGVSNYGYKDIEALLEYAKAPPMVNQIKFHPASHDLPFIDYCKKNNIVVEAYSPLGHGNLIQSPRIVQMAQRYNKTSAQILIRWALEHGTVPLPKSTHPARIKENFEVFDFSLTPQDVKLLNELG